MEVGRSTPPPPSPAERTVEEADDAGTSEERSLLRASPPTSSRVNFAGYLTRTPLDIPQPPLYMPRLGPAIICERSEQAKPPPYTRIPIPDLLDSVHEIRTPVKDFMLANIVTAAFCCLPVSMWGIYKSYACIRAREAGDIRKARQLSTQAQLMASSSFAIGLFILVAVVLFNFFSVPSNDPNDRLSYWGDNWLDWTGTLVPQSK